MKNKNKFNLRTWLENAVRTLLGIKNVKKGSTVELEMDNLYISTLLYVYFDTDGVMHQQLQPEMIDVGTASQSKKQKKTFINVDWDRQFEVNVMNRCLEPNDVMEARFKLSKDGELLEEKIHWKYQFSNGK